MNIIFVITLQLLWALCVTGSETETTDHFLLHCPFFTVNRQKLLNGLLNILKILLKIVIHPLNKLLRSFCLFTVLWKTGKATKSGQLFHFRIQSHIGLRASLKLWRKLCLFKWLNRNSNLNHNNLTPARSWIANNNMVLVNIRTLLTRKYLFTFNVFKEHCSITDLPFLLLLFLRKFN